MGFASFQVFLILGLLATSCIAQAPGAAPTQPPKSAPAPSPTTTTPPSQAPSPGTSTPSPPAPGTSGLAPGPGGATPSSEPPPAASAPSAAFSIGNTFAAGTALVGAFVTMALA